MLVPTPLDAAATLPVAAAPQPLFDASLTVGFRLRACSSPAGGW